MRGAHGAPYGLFTQTIAMAMLFAPEQGKTQNAIFVFRYFQSLEAIKNCGASMRRGNSELVRVSLV